MDTNRALAFCLPAALFVLAYPRQWLLAGLAIAVAAVAIEGLQEFSPTRYARLDDAMIKAVGAYVGILVGRAVGLVLQRYGRPRTAVAN